MGLLQDLDIVKGKGTLAGGIFEELFPAFQEYLIKTAKDLLETQAKLQSSNSDEESS